MSLLQHSHRKHCVLSARCFALYVESNRLNSRSFSYLFPFYLFIYFLIFFPARPSLASTTGGIRPDWVPMTPSVLALGGWFLCPRVLLPSQWEQGPPLPPGPSSGHLPLATSWGPKAPVWILHLHPKAAPPPCPLLTGPLGAHPGAGAAGLE